MRLRGFVSSLLFRFVGLLEFPLVVRSPCLTPSGKGLPSLVFIGTATRLIRPHGSSDTRYGRHNQQDSKSKCSNCIQVRWHFLTMARYRSDDRTSKLRHALATAVHTQAHLHHKQLLRLNNGCVTIHDGATGPKRRVQPSSASSAFHLPPSALLAGHDSHVIAIHGTLSNIPGTPRDHEKSYSI